MRRDEFENHKLWIILEDIDIRITGILDSGHVGATPSLETIRFYVAHVRSFRDLGTTNVALFTDQMMDPVAQIFADVSRSLDLYANREASSFLDQAVHQAESVLMDLAPWPRPFGRGRQVQQISSLYEDLLQLQRESIGSLQSAHDRLRAEIEEFRKAAKDERDLNLHELEYLRKEAQESVQAVSAEKRRIDEVVKSGIQQTADLRRGNEKALEELSEDLSESFDNRFQPLEDGIRERLAEAGLMLQELQRTETAYNNISTQAASDKLAEHFEREAKVGRATGISAYALGFVFLGLSALPLLFLLQPVSAPASIEPTWTAIVTRLSIGVIGASAATVVIRLGAKFINGAAQSKRMELELRTFGPFLANVEDQTTVDQARLDLIDKSFGQPSADRSDAKEEVVPVSALGHLTDLLSKALSR